MTRRASDRTDSDSNDASPSPEELLRWGLDPTWSRRVSFAGAGGRPVSWHVLDTGPAPRGTIVCVHGNPTWGYLWRDLLATLSPDWRVIAIDQTGMGYSQRSGSRDLAERIAELVSFCRQEVADDLVLAAHDWGGPVAIGAARDLSVRALIVANSAVAKPPDVRVPPLIGAVRLLRDVICRRTPLFVNAAAAMAPRSDRAALRAPYLTARRRAAIAEFVADIPVGPFDHSANALGECAATLNSLSCPMLILWGGRDPVFHDRFLRDLRRRVPTAQVERFRDAGHLVLLEEPVGAVIKAWLDVSLPDAPAPTTSTAASARRVDRGDSNPRPRSPLALPLRSVLTDLEQRAHDGSLVYQGPDGSITWASLATRSTVAAAALQRSGVSSGDRVSLLIPPGVELMIAAVATWKVGAVAVIADASAGVRQLRRLIRGAAPALVIGTPATLLTARLGRFAPGARGAAFASLPGVTDLREPNSIGVFVPASLLAEDLAAVVHTSGATGPAKPVGYTHGALAAQRTALSRLLRGSAHQSYVTSFAPFMLLAPVIGMGCVRPDFNVNRASQLDFDALSAAVTGTDVSTAWLSPAAAQTVVATAHGRQLSLGLVMLAGAPISTSLVRRVQAMTGADVRTPYGMTECLPVTDGTDPLAVGTLGGASTGRPITDCLVVIVALDDANGPALEENRWGEILVSAPWMFDSYDARWSADDATTRWRDGQRFHRTGDVGYWSAGRLFLLGRVQHVLRTASGPVTSVAIEEPIAAALERPVAAVAVGPAGTSVVALVIGDEGKLRLAPDADARDARAHSIRPLAAVLRGRLPTDRRHESKVDRTGLAASVSDFLAGR